MIRTDSRERGFALAATILALVLVGALVTGGFFAASQEHRIGTSTQFSSEAFYYAERGLNDALGGMFTRGMLETLIPNWPGGSISQGPFTITSNGQPVGDYTLNVVRLDTLLYFVAATGRVREGGIYGGATHRLGVIARGTTMDLPRDRALQIYGSISMAGNAEVDGRDTIPTAWDGLGCASSGTVAGIVTRNAASVEVKGSAQIIGNPQVEEDPTMDDDNFLSYGDMSFDELMALANIRIPEGEVASIGPTLDSKGNCDTSNRYNWGAPMIRTHPCFNYFPIVYAEGDLKLKATGTGQGILLVEGDLELNGGMEFYGITIVKGALRTYGNGGHLNGITIVYGGGELNPEETIARGDSEVNFSSCAIDRALDGNPWTSRLVPVDQLSWIDLTAAGG